MNRINIGQINGYAQVDAIEAFIERSLEMDEGIAVLLRNDDPSRHIVVKPNWVQEAHEHKPDVWLPVITHPTIVIAVVKRLAQQMNGKGTVTVCDAPHTYANFKTITQRGDLCAQLESVREQWPTLNLELIDLRREVWFREEEVVVERQQNPEDPRGYVRVNLSKNSLFYRHPGEGRYYGADYDSAVVNKHHCGDVQEYLVAGTPVACDLFINLPKMKTHKKTGITCCLKNLVGINGDKNWLPHHTEAGPVSVGDEFPQQRLEQRLEAGLKKFGQQLALKVPGLGTWLYRKMRNAGKQVLGDSDTVIRNGNWSGNDTCWRMALDLNRALLYSNLDGSLRDSLQPKAYLAIVDGIIGGEGNGPLCPAPVNSNVLISGTNPAEVDAVVAKLMGFDPERIPIIERAFDPHRFPISNTQMEDLTVFDQRERHDVLIAEIKPSVACGFTPHFGWSDVLNTNAIHRV